MRHTHKLGACA